FNASTSGNPVRGFIQGDRPSLCVVRAQGPYRRIYLPPRHPAEGVNWAAGFLSFSEGVLLEGKPVGKIYLEEDLNDVNARRIHFAWVTAMMALACMTLVYALLAAAPNHCPAHSAIGRYRAERGFREELLSPGAAGRYR